MVNTVAQRCRSITGFRAGSILSMSKSIFITGAAAGIGQATARLFARKGWQVGLYDVDIAGLEALQQELGDCSWWQRLDVLNDSEVQAAIEQFAAKTGGQMDVLFNCAGLLTTGAFMENAAGTAQRLFGVNVFGLESVTRLAYPLLATTNGARVINMSSASALYGVPDFALYSASKFAVRGLTEALNIEWQQHDIYVCDVMPPFVDTGMVSNANRVQSIDKLGVKLTAGDVAAVVWKASQKRKLHWQVGVGNAVQASVLSRLPVSAARGFVRRVAGY